LFPCGCIRRRILFLRSTIRACGPSHTGDSMKSVAEIRRIARHLINFPKPETTKILTSIPSDDRIKIIEEIKRIKNDKKN
jgi:hypothetical protein